MSKTKLPSAHDVAKYILRAKGEMSPWRLHKLLYYSQAWHLAWENEPLFKEQIRAWSVSPVVPALYPLHKGTFIVKTWPQGRISNLSPNRRESIDAVLKHYGELDNQHMQEVLRSEAPWREARAGLDITERGNRTITLEAMRRYYQDRLGADAEPDYELDCRPGAFRALQSGQKTFEILRADRDYKAGERLRLRERRSKERERSDRELIAEITYVVKGPPALKPGYVALALRVLPQ